MNDEDLDELFVLDVTITLELPGGWIIGSIALSALTDALSRLEHDDIRPYHTTIEITEKTTRLSTNSDNPKTSGDTLSTTHPQPACRRRPGPSGRPTLARELRRLSRSARSLATRS
jgi:hypothetical protein